MVEETLRFEVVVSSNTLYAIIICLTAILGLVFNSYALWILYFGGKIQNSFQQICFSFCFANFMEHLLFLLFVTPNTYFNLYDFTQHSYIARWISAFMTFFFNVSVFSHLIVSVNRLLVITWPTKSRRFISRKVSVLMIASVWLYSSINYLPYLIVDQCYIQYDTKQYIFTYPDTVCGSILPNIQYWAGIVSTAFVVAADAWTLSRLVKYIYSNGSSLHVQDIRFFLQSVLQSIIYINTLVLFFVVSPFYEKPVPNVLGLFLTNTWVWQITQTLDGAIILPFHLWEYKANRQQHKERSETSVRIVIN